MADKSTPVRAAQALAIFLSAAASGASLALSGLVIPRLLESPVPLMLRQWQRSFDVTKRAIPGVDAVAAAAYFYLAYRFGRVPGATGVLLSAGRTARLYLAAGALCVGIVPYTLAVVMPTNRKLLAKAGQTRLMADTDEVVETAAREETAKYLVDHWGMLNLPRAAMLALASAIGIYASL